MTKEQPGENDLEVLKLKYENIQSEERWDLNTSPFDKHRIGILAADANQQTAVEDFDLGNETDAQLKEIQFSDMFLGADDAKNEQGLKKIPGTDER